MVSLDTMLVAPEDHRLFFLCLPFDVWIGFLQPLADFFGVLVVGMATWLLGGVAPAFEVFANRPHRHQYAILFVDQLAHRTTRPQWRLDAQFGRTVLVNELLNVFTLFICQCSARTQRTSSPLIGKPVQPVGLVRTPPPGDGLTSHTQHLGHVALAQTHLAAPQGTQPQFVEHFIWQLACIRQCDGHDSFSCSWLTVPSFLCEQLSCQGNKVFGRSLTHESWTSVGFPPWPTPLAAPTPSLSGPPPLSCSLRDELVTP